MKKILALHTGGTIAMSADESGNVTPGDENPLDNYQSSFGTDIELETEDVFVAAHHPGTDVAVKATDR